MVYVFAFEKEIWKPIKYNGVRASRYKISNYGKVYSEYTNRILSPKITSAGYQQFDLSSDIKERGIITVLGHRLVATAFVPNPNPEIYNFVNHRIPIIPSNGVNFYDNYYENLEWSNNKLNQVHARDNGLLHPHKGELHSNHVYTEDFIRRICKYIAEGMASGEIYKNVSDTEDITYQKIISLVTHLRKKERWAHIANEYF